MNEETKPETAVEVTEPKKKAPKKKAAPKRKKASRPKRKAALRTRPKLPASAERAVTFWGVVSVRSGKPCLYSISFESAAKCLQKHRRMTKMQKGRIGGEVVRQYKTQTVKDIRL